MTTLAIIVGLALSVVLIAWAFGKGLACAETVETTSPRPSPPSEGGEGVQRARGEGGGAAGALPPGNPFGVVIVGEEPRWLDIDREVWRIFLKTETGARLRERIRFYEQGQNRKAVLCMDARAAARAAGFHDCAAWLEQHSADVAPEIDESQPYSAGVADLVERHTP